MNEWTKEKPNAVGLYLWGKAPWTQLPDVMTVEVSMDRLLCRWGEPTGYDSYRWQSGTPEQTPDVWFYGPIPEMEVQQ